MLILTTVYQNVLNNMNKNMLPILLFLTGILLCLWAVHEGISNLITYYSNPNAVPTSIDKHARIAVATNWLAIGLGSISVISNLISIIIIICRIN